MGNDAEIRRLLRAQRDGDREAFDRLVRLLYDDLHRIAGRELRRGRPGALRTTELVHEAYLKLVHHEGLDLRDRRHLLAIVARAMRQVVVDHARRLGARKRGGGREVLTLDEERIAVGRQADSLLSLDRSLEELESYDPRLVRVVECRFFAGLTVPETAETLDVSTRTVERDWARARAWLRVRLAPERREGS